MVSGSPMAPASNPGLAVVPPGLERPVLPLARFRLQCGTPARHAAAETLGRVTVAALTRPRRARRLAHAQAALGSFVARSQMHLCPDGHRRMFTARARG